MADLTITARYYGPAFAAGEPRQIVIHSVESGIVAGLAASLAGGWFRNPDNKTSAHNIADQRDSVTMVPDGQRAWHVGNGNNTSWGKEHCGRAAFSRAQWTTPDGLAMLRNSARDAARRAKLAGIPARWLTLTQLAADEKGFCTHNDMRLVRGGTTHTDPGPGFPYDLYLSLVREAMGEKPPTHDVPGSYTVRPGDTLTGIASRTKTTVEDLVRWNGIRDPDVITVGQVLKLTTGVTSTGGQSVPKPKPAPQPAPRPTIPADKRYRPLPGGWPFRPPNYVGDIRGDRYSHGGGARGDNPAVEWVQRALWALGYGKAAPDGKFEAINVQWLANWQRDYYRRHGLRLDYPGRCYGDDYRYLDAEWKAKG